MTDYDLPITAYHYGDRIEAHPVTDIWMSGDRYGKVIAVGHKYVYAIMDRSGRTQPFLPRNLGKLQSDVEIR